MSTAIFPVFLITFREALEAALIIVIIASYLKKIGRQSLHRYVYAGVAVALVLSLTLGVGIFTIYGQLQPPAEQIFEGVAALTAAAVLSYMIFWMAKNARRIGSTVEEKIDVAVTSGQVMGIFSLSFVAVFREGVETVLFLTALVSTDIGGMIVGFTLGCGVIVLLTTILYKRIHRLNIKKLFRYSSLMLIVFAAGLAAYGVHELLEAGETLGTQLGVLGQIPFDINPPVNQDGSYPLFHEKGTVGSVAAALVGYDGNPELLRLAVYSGYWVVVGLYVLRSFRERSY